MEDCALTDIHAKCLGFSYAMQQDTEIDDIQLDRGLSSMDPSVSPSVLLPHSAHFAFGFTLNAPDCHQVFDSRIGVNQVAADSGLSSNARQLLLFLLPSFYYVWQLDDVKKW